jgi:hypothetical protein
MIKIGYIQQSKVVHNNKAHSLPQLSDYQIRELRRQLSEELRLRTYYQGKKER